MKINNLEKYNQVKDFLEDEPILKEEFEELRNSLETFSDNHSISPEDREQDLINSFHRCFCTHCYFEYTCKKVRLLNCIKCGFKPTHKLVWKIVDPANATCTQCGLYICNDSGTCPKCSGYTKKRWKQEKVRASRYEKIKDIID